MGLGRQEHVNRCRRTQRTKKPSESRRFPMMSQPTCAGVADLQSAPYIDSTSTIAMKENTSSHTEEHALSFRSLAVVRCQPPSVPGNVSPVEPCAKRGEFPTAVAQL